jgi:hypothetical protein
VPVCAASGTARKDSTDATATAARIPEILGRQDNSTGVIERLQLAGDRVVQPGVHGRPRQGSVDEVDEGISGRQQIRAPDPTLRRKCHRVRAVSRLCAREDSDVLKLGITAASTCRRRDRLYGGASRSGTGSGESWFEPRRGN